MDLFQRVELTLLWQREFRKACAELASSSERELNADRRWNRSDVPEIAAAVAEPRVAVFVRNGWPPQQA
jgi:hypothetical protein